MKTKILILCTGNSCRSQMAHGFLQSFDGELDVHSAGASQWKTESKSCGSNERGWCGYFTSHIRQCG